VRRERLLLVVAVVAAALALAPTAGATPTSSKTAIVSLGDSYISGEAGRWQGNSIDAAGDRDGTDRAAYNCTATVCSYDSSRVYGASAANGCDRSDVAEIKSATIAVDQKINLACSGATTANIFRSSQGGADEKGEPPQGDQLRYVAQTWNVKLVILSIGGNDLGFADIVQACATAYLSAQGPCHTAQQQVLDSKFGAAMKNVARAIDEVRAIMTASGYTKFRFIVQSYPSVFVRASDNRYPETDRAQRAGIGGCPSYDADADWARDSVVSQISNGLKFVAVAKGVQFLDLRDAFEGREICSDSTEQASLGHPPSGTTSEWGRLLNQSTVSQGVLQEAVHPNAYGERALGRCLTLIYGSFSRGGNCTNTPGQGPDAMKLAAF
jgi:GDSL-like lipase/acylhydrolase family protein